MTRQLGVDLRATALTLVDVLAGRVAAADATLSDVVAGVDVIAGARELSGVEMALVGEIGRERFLADALEPLRDAYATIVFDTPPNLGLLTGNALVCADVILAPVSCEDEASVQGLVELRSTVSRLDRLRDRTPELMTLAVAPTTTNGSLNRSDVVAPAASGPATTARPLRGKKSGSLEQSSALGAGAARRAAPNPPMTAVAGEPWRVWSGQTRVASYRLPDELVAELGAAARRLHLPVGLLVTAAIAHLLDHDGDVIQQLVDRADDTRIQGRRGARRQAPPC